MNAALADGFKFRMCSWCQGWLVLYLTLMLLRALSNLDVVTEENSSGLSEIPSGLIPLWWIYMGTDTGGAGVGFTDFTDGEEERTGNARGQQQRSRGLGWNKRPHLHTGIPNGVWIWILTISISELFRSRKNKWRGSKRVTWYPALVTPQKVNHGDIMEVSGGDTQFY